MLEIRLLLESVGSFKSQIQLVISVFYLFLRMSQTRKDEASFVVSVKSDDVIEDFEIEVSD